GRCLSLLGLPSPLGSSGQTVCVGGEAPGAVMNPNPEVEGYSYVNLVLGEERRRGRRPGPGGHAARREENFSPGRRTAAPLPMENSRSPWQASHGEHQIACIPWESSSGVRA